MVRYKTFLLPADNTVQSRFDAEGKELSPNFVIGIEKAKLENLVFDSYCVSVELSLPRSGFPLWPRGWPRSGFRINGRGAATSSLASVGYAKKDQSGASVPIL